MIHLSQNSTSKNLGEFYKFQNKMNEQLTKTEYDSLFIDMRFKLWRCTMKGYSLRVLTFQLSVIKSQLFPQPNHWSSIDQLLIDRRSIKKHKLLWTSLVDSRSIKISVEKLKKKKNIWMLSWSSLINREHSIDTSIDRVM